MMQVKPKYRDRLASSVAIILCIPWTLCRSSTVPVKVDTALHTISDTTPFEELDGFSVCAKPNSLVFFSLSLSPLYICTM